MAGLLLLYEAENYEHGRESFPVRFSRSMKEVIHETVTCKLFTKEEGGKTDDLLWKVSVCSLPYFYAPVSQRPAGFVLISTIAAVVTASVALLLMNFSKSGKTVDESRAWLKRIIITWAILNGLGFIMAYITPFFAGGQWNG